MIDKQLKILLLGGTGAIGSHLSEILSTQGHLIFITSRKNRVENLNIKYITLIPQHYYKIFFLST